MFVATTHIDNAIIGLYETFEEAQNRCLQHAEIYLSKIFQAGEPSPRAEEINAHVKFYTIFEAPAGVDVEFNPFSFREERTTTWKAHQVLQ